MKRLLFPIVAVLVLATGCVFVPASSQPPTAYIDLVSPANAILGETVIFTGHGVDPDGSIGAYNWQSSLDGDLSTLASFKTSSLSQGTHSVWFKVQDDGGQWSKEVLTTVIVVPTGFAPLVVNSFDANPGEIAPGGSSTLGWDVSGATTVSIDPQIGSVALRGTRVVLPKKTTTYTLTATNAIGTVKSTAQVVVTSMMNTIELFSLPAENGYVTKGGYIGQGAIVGYTAKGLGAQGFLSFDISGVPKDIVIKSVLLDLDAGAVQVKGDPFARLGRLYISKCTYEKLRANSYWIGPTTEAICSFVAWPSNCTSSSISISALQEQLDAGSNRFQVRMSFLKDWPSSEDNYLDFSQANPKLIIEYD